MCIKFKTVCASTLLAITIPTISSAFFVHSGTWLARFRTLQIVTTVSSGAIDVIGGKVTSATSTKTPELDVTYFLSDSIAAEISGAQNRTSLKATDTSIGEVDLGRVTLFSPTLMLQYHIPLFKANTRAYFGVGVNYTRFNKVNPGTFATNISYHNHWGTVWETGVDYYINNNWFINADVKKTTLKTTMTITTPTGTLKNSINFNPIFYGAGFGYDFS